MFPRLHVTGCARKEVVDARASSPGGWAFRPYQAGTAKPYPALGMGETGAEGEKERALFIQDFVDVGQPIEAAEGWCHGDGSRLEPLASAAGEDAHELLVRIGPSWASGRLSRDVRVALGACRERGAGRAVSIRWEAMQFSGLFPVLDGDLEFAPIGPSQCRIILSASYVAPLGELGRRLDRAVLHRVAESTVRSFLVRLAATLESTEGAGGSTL